MRSSRADRYTKVISVCSCIKGNTGALRVGYMGSRAKSAAALAAAHMAVN
jgi:hypothetical protein